MARAPETAHHRRRRPAALRVADLRSEALRTTLWVVPSIVVALSVVLFAVTNMLDRAAYAGELTVPAWIDTGDADAARLILTAIAGSVITVVGVVFSITILALTLASTQFGPRMLRNFIRDTGIQLCLGVFVGTVVFSVLTLASVSNDGSHPFVPHYSVTMALGLTLVSLGVLIYFIHHVATSIQLNEVVHGIAVDLDRSIAQMELEVRNNAGQGEPSVLRSMSVDELNRRLDEQGATIPAMTSGYLQAVGHRRVVRIARRAGAAIRIVHRPGHFVVQGRPIAVVWPADAAPDIARALRRAHAIGPNRTLSQDLQFALDQLVEIAIRALSPAVNDTFTALTCIDWLGDGLCKLVADELPDGVFRDELGEIRLLEVALNYSRLIDRSFDKIRQAGRGMPAVGIRQLENLAKIAEHTRTSDQRSIVRRQADMILRSARDAVPEPDDVADVESAHQGVVQAIARVDDSN